MKSRALIKLSVVGIVVACMAGLLLKVFKGMPHDAGVQTVIGEAPHPFLEVIGGHHQHLGKLRKNERLKHQFQIVNRSAEIITIKSVRGSCGCLGADRATETQVPPAGKTAVDVEVIGTSQIKRFNDKYHIRVDIDNQLPLVISFSFDLVADVDVYPENVSARPTYASETMSGNLLLTPIEPLSQVQILEAHSQKGLLHIASLEQLSNSARCKYTSQLLSPGKYDDIIILTTNGSIDREILVPVSWTVLPNIQITPPTIYMGNLSTSSPNKGVFRVRNRDKSSVVVAGMSYNKERLRVYPRIGSGDNQEYEVEVLNNFSMPDDGVFRETIKISTNDGEVDVSIFGTYR